jgi:hypothetical protein
MMCMRLLPRAQQAHAAALSRARELLVLALPFSPGEPHDGRQTRIALLAAVPAASTPEQDSLDSGAVLFFG